LFGGDVARRGEAVLHSLEQDDRLRLVDFDEHGHVHVDTNEY